MHETFIYDLIMFRVSNVMHFSLMTLPLKNLYPPVPNMILLELCSSSNIR